MKTVLGYEDVSVVLLNGDSATVRVSQVQVAQYPKAFEVYDNEMKLTELICGKEDGFVSTLKVDSYELLYSKSEELNKDGFFVYAERQTKRLDDKLARRMNAMPESLMKALGEKAVASTLPSSLVGLQPR